MTSHSQSHHTKSISSQQDTRNPTTNKKVIYYTPVQKHSHPKSTISHNRHSLNRSAKHALQFQSQRLTNKCKRLNQSMYYSQQQQRYQLNQRKQSCIRSSRYNQAKQIGESLVTLQRKRAKTQIKYLVSQHKIQHKMIHKAHKKQMSKFEEVWQNYFIGLKAKQQVTLIQFRNSQQNDIRFVQEELVQKCKWLKPTTGQLKSLEKKQKQLQKQQRLDELIHLKKQKKHIKQKLLQQQHEKIYSWAKKQQDFLKTYHTKKYNALINRIEEMHNDKYRQYQREGQRLRLKYNNVLRKLQHQQKLQINQLLQRYSFVKDQFKGRSLTVNL